MCHFNLRRALRNRLASFALFFLLLLRAAPAEAQTRVIVQVQGGFPAIQTLCVLLGCSVQYNLGDPQGQVFLVTAPVTLPLNLIADIPGVLDVEIDQLGQAMDTASQGSVPSALYDSAPVSYYGTIVHHGYLVQPATQIVGLASAQSAYQVSGAGIVAIIDTGVDPTHPVLANVLLPGYDFTRNQSGANELLDLGQPQPGQADQSTAAVVDQSTAAVVDASTAEYLNQPQYQDFGHGTMVAGVVHLVAPTALILPLRAFGSDGTGYLSNVLRAIYYIMPWASMPES